MGLAAVVLVVAGAAIVATAGPATRLPATAAISSGQLYFTTTRPAAVQEVTYSFRDAQLHLSGEHTIARLKGADGVLFAPDGELVVGGVHTGDVYLVNPATGTSTAVSAGVGASMHLSLSPDRRSLYTSGEPGPMAVLAVGSTTAGAEVPLHGATTTVTAIAFGPSDQVLYTKSAPDGRGDIGVVNLTTGATRALFRNIVGAHGILFDAYSDSYLVVGGDVVLQIAASDLTRIESEVVLQGNRFDQGSVTGSGQLLVASNLGSLVFIDYSHSKRVGDVANTVIQEHVARNLDDVAPLIGPGARPIETNAGELRAVGGLAVAVGVLLGLLVTAQLFLSRRRQRTLRPKDRQLPRWDRRRKLTNGAPW